MERTILLKYVKILLNHRNNDVNNSSMTGNSVKCFGILSTSLSVCNYFDGLTKFTDLCLAKFLDTLKTKNKLLIWFNKNKSINRTILSVQL